MASTVQAHDELPLYLVVKTEQSEGWFAAPDFIPAGSRVRTDAPFGPHFTPLNEAAQAKMQAWLDEEYPAADREGRPLIQDGKPVMYKPHRRSNFGVNSAPHIPYSVTVEAEPARDTRKLQTLAEIQAAGPKATDQRPPPDSYRLPPRDASVPPVVTSAEGEVVAVVEAAGPPISTVTRKV